MVMVVVEFCYFFFFYMIKSGYGCIVNVFFIMVFLLSCFGMMMYVVFKIFLVEFIEMFWVEVKGMGVKVIVFCLGFVESEFFDVNGVSDKVVVVFGFVWMQVDKMV